MKFNKILGKWYQVSCSDPNERAKIFLREAKDMGKKESSEWFFSRYGQYFKEADGMSEQYAVEAETWVIVLK